MNKGLNIAIIGASFMGKAHSNAYLDVEHYFSLSKPVVMHTICDVNQKSAEQLAAKYGWKHVETDWKKVIENKDIDLIDICTPNNTHMQIAIAAAKSGKHIICEKPIALTADEARQMSQAAQKANVRNMTAFNYRRVPAIALARHLIDSGKIGDIHHFNAVYYQDWLVDPEAPFIWRLDASIGGSGAHGDMNAHTVDLARFLVGEFESVSAAKSIFTQERKKPDGSMGQVTADDALYFTATFENGALGNFMATRYATDRKNFLRCERFGSKGAVTFNLERLNELEYYSRDDDAQSQGFRTIIVTEQSHPYLQMWWPPGHIIGWEHTFIHEIGDLLTAIESGSEVKADFYDGYRCQQILDAASESAEAGEWKKIPKD